MNGAEPTRDLVLLGGGHSHALALRMLAMQPPAATRITLVSDTDFAPYSGMLPGLVAGHYRFEETHIDLRRFCSARGIRFVRATATGIDRERRRVLLAGRPALEYDVLSINIGAQPELSVPGAREHAVPVKPVGSFYQRWQALEKRVRKGSHPRILLVGGGAGSVELALAMRHRLGDAAEIGLLAGEELLPGYNRRARETVRRSLASSQVELRESSRVTGVTEAAVEIGDRSEYCDELIWCTGVVPVNWLADTGFAADERGFLLVEDSLQVVGEQAVFAAGDVAVQRDHPRPRAGVFAVRQAPVLADNLAAAVASQPLRVHRPQRRFLSLLSLGGRQAVADRGFLSASGGWAWRWKDRIDRKFMAQFSEAPPAMAPARPGREMHCGGCGAKLPASILREALANVAAGQPGAISLKRLKDDAAVLDWPADKLVQTVDTLRDFISDPWLMGRITALHALSDIYAMGAVPHSAQVNVCLPYAGASLQRRELEQLLAGLAQELAGANCALVGGHSMEGPELSLGLAVNGSLSDAGVLAKSGANVGDQLVLTKPLGTGVIFAAAMSGEAGGDCIAAAIDSMLRSNRAAADLARQYGASACTDITGFGLAGHLSEMLDKRQQAVLTRLPALPGAEALLLSGHRSTLHEGNLAALAEPVFSRKKALPMDAWPALLCDPQTSGGLLIAISESSAAALVSALEAAGENPTVVGEVREAKPKHPRIVFG
ncbi:MAG: selenide, water dikinase SelD [Halieaceae bacterium]|nr:selenide, water dikinase SelD [Halieaceae bacterium]